MAEEAPAEQAIVFHIEVPGAVGLPKPDVTYVQLSGLGLQEDYASEAQVEESSEPGPWLFQSLEALAEAKRLKAEAEANQGKKKKDDKEESRPGSIDPPNAVCRIARPCKLPAERQKLLDSACRPLLVTLWRHTATPVELGRASLQLSPLIHDTASLDLDLELQWSEALLSELKADFDERVAAEAAAKAEAEAAEAAAKAESGEAEAPEDDEAPPEAAAPPQFEAPKAGRLRLKISTAAPMGRILCPEDLHDWAVLTTRIEGIYQLPTKLLEAGGPLPELGTAEGVVEAHPLRYAVRLLGCDFNGGQLVLPHVDLPPPEDAEAAAAAAAAEGPEGAEAAAPEEPEMPESPTQADISFDIGTEEFQESLLRAGYPAARRDGPAVFSFLCRPRTGLGGRIGLHDFLRLLEIHLPAPTELLLELHGAIIEKHESLEMAFNDMDSAAEGALTRESLAQGIEDMGLSKTPEEVEALFVALDTGRSGSISREDLRVLSMAKRRNDLEMSHQAVKWLTTACGSMAKLLEQVDEQLSGSISKEQFVASAQRLGLTDTLGVELAFTFAQLMEGGAESLSHQSFLSLEALEVENLPSLLVKLEELLLFGSAELPGAAPGQLALQRLAPAEAEAGEVESITCKEFIAGLSQLDGTFSAPSAQCLFFLLDGSNLGTLDALAFSSLPALNAANAWRRLADCRRFIEEGFGEIDSNAFRALFEGYGEDVFQEAEESQPHILFDDKVQVAYRGREWLQKLLNTLGDERGRDPVEDVLSKTGGTWLYMFPTLGQDAALVDYKELSEPQATHGKLARWHHAQSFVDLRRLVAPAKSETSGPMLEFRAYLTQVSELPPRAEYPEGEWSTAYTTCRSYVKGVISLDRPLQRLCPRDVRPAQLLSGESYIPPPPPKRPPPTVNEDLEKEAASVIARLSFDFARWCYDSGYIESKIVGPGGELSPNPTLGKKGVVRRAFLQWLEQDSEGTSSLKDLGNALRPAVVRLMRVENKNGPACGLSGNENDAKYTYLRDYISRHLFRALNNEVERHRKLRDERIWRSQVQETEADAAESWQKQDAVLKRLTVEYELLGDWQRAREVYEDWLALEPNVENGEAWFSFARFLMRSGQNQLDAERVLRYAISLRTEDEGPALQEVAFLASLLQTHRLPSSLDEGGRSARFQAALAMMESYADRHACEPMSMHIIFLLFAVEAEGLRQIATGDVSEEEAQQLTEDSDRLSAEAAKYLELARASPLKWQGTLEAQPSFPELTQLVAKESLNRQLRPEAPEVPETPAAWLPSTEPTPFADAETLKTAPEREDALALEVIDLLLHFGVSDLASFLLEDAVQAYGYLSPVTVRSERCQLQRVKVAMLAKDWNKAEQLFQELFQRRGGDRWPEAHGLLGECRYRRARDEGASSAGYASALEEFETALCFMTEETSGPKSDPVLQLRVGSILHMQSEEQNFSDQGIAERAVKHYKKSAMVCPTAEAWKNIGLCRYRRVKFEATTARKEKKLREAMKYLEEANTLDRERPDIVAWLTICAVELGLVQVAKQGFRQLMQFEERLASAVALELAEVLLRFSNEQRAGDWGGERGRLVQDGRYCKEAAMLSKALLARGESGRARCILAWSKFLSGDHGSAAGEFCAALTSLVTEEPQMLEEAAYMARHCASLIPGEPQLSALVEEAIAVACEPPAPDDESGLALSEGDQDARPEAEEEMTEKERKGWEMWER